MSKHGNGPEEERDADAPAPPIEAPAAQRGKRRRLGAPQIVLAVTLVVLAAATLTLTLIIVTDRPARAVSLDRTGQARESFLVAHDKALSPAAITLEQVVLRLEPGKPWKGVFSARGGLTRVRPSGHLIFILPPEAIIDYNFVERFTIRNQFPLTRGDVRRYADRVAVTLPFVPARTPLPASSTVDFEVAFRWSNPESRSLGTGRKQFAVRYGSLLRTVIGLETGRLEPWIAFGGASGFHAFPEGAPQLEVDIHLPDPNERFIDPFPPPSGGGFNEEEWTQQSLTDSLTVETVTENEWTRHKLDLLSGLLFTLVGLILGEGFGYLVAVAAHRRAAQS
jgi:hypothetical protein